uniref:Uncharacterized protein n=1 Tax=Panagrolaimus sp. PS1159 TaxID=55785 RepID=A0AC35GH89_9BILA
MNHLYFVTVLVFAFTISNVENAVARFEVELGNYARFDFGREMILIKRTTSLSDEAQYLFAGPNQDGSWTTDGTDKIPSNAHLYWNGTITDKIPSNAHLYWNGTIVFKSITKDDLGSYEMPLEPQRQHLAKTMIDIVLKGQ